MADVRIVNDGQNNGPVISANVRKLARANALVVTIVNPSGDISWPLAGAGGSGGDGAILDGANSAIKASVEQYLRSNPLAVVLKNASGDTYNANEVSIVVPPVTVAKWNLTPTQDTARIEAGLIGVTGDVSTIPKPGSTWPVSIAATVPVSFPGGISIGAVTAPVGVTGDVTTVPKPGQAWPVREQAVTGVQIVGGGNARVSISGDTLPVTQLGAWSTAVSGDVSTVPKSGQVWPTREQGTVGVQINGGSVGAQVSPSGDFPVRVAAITVPIGISGDVLVRGGNAVAVKVDGSAVTQPVSFPGGISIGAVTAPIGVTGDVSTKPAAGQTWPVSFNQTVPVTEQNKIGVHVAAGSVSVTGDVLIRGTVPVSQQGVTGVQIVGGGTNRVSISGDQLAVIQTGAWATAVTGDVTTIPKPGQTWPVNFAGTIGVQIIGGGTNRVSVSGDQLPVTQVGTWATAVTGDVSTIPKAGQVWPVREQAVTGVQVIGGVVSISGDSANPINVDIASITAPVGITGDVSTIPKSGQVWPVREQSVQGVYIVGGSGQGTAGVSGDVTTVPKAGQVWPVREQNVQGVYIVGGSGQGTAGISGDVAIKPSLTTNVGRFPMSGDTGLSDGLNRAILATVKQFTRSNPVSVVLTNASGDQYNAASPMPNLAETVSGRLTTTGSRVVASAAVGKRLYVTAYDFQAEADFAYPNWAAGASGSQLSPQWILGAREGVAKQVSGPGYIFRTTPGGSLSLENNGNTLRWSATYYTGDA
jgi:hypothetical protein